MHPIPYPATEAQWDHGMSMFLAMNEVPDTAERWSSWPVIARRLDETYQAEYSHHPVLSLGPDIANDARVGHLRGWASFHRTAVVVNWRNLRHFKILPDLSRKHTGRAIWIELGDDGARHWWLSGYSWPLAASSSSSSSLCGHQGSRVQENDAHDEPAWTIVSMSPPADKCVN